MLARVSPRIVVFFKEFIRRLRGKAASLYAGLASRGRVSAGITAQHMRSFFVSEG